MKKTVVVSVENGVIHAIEGVEVTINISDVVARQHALDTKLAEVNHIEIDLSKTPDEINAQVSERYKAIEEIKSEQTALSKLLDDANNVLQPKSVIAEPEVEMKVEDAVEETASVVVEHPFREATEKEEVVEKVAEEVKVVSAEESEDNTTFINVDQVKAENKVQEQDRLPSSFSGWRR